jgi:C4-type Zn-finger protein
MAALPSGEAWKQGNEDDMSTLWDCFCPNCQEGGAITTMLPTKVPLFREIIIMNLTCDACGFPKPEVTFGGEIQKREND